jgi:hypothetical protein
MALKDLSEFDRRVVHQCLMALRGQHLLAEWEFGPRVGVVVEVYDEIVARWPAIDDGSDDSDECLVLNNAMNEICHGIRFEPGEWDRSFTVTRDDVRTVYDRWARSRGWKDTGIR